MAEADWSVLSTSLDTGSVRRGVTSGATPPNGGGSFVYGFNSVELVQGAVGLYVNDGDFGPTALGASIRGTVKRGTSVGKTNFSPFLFLGLQTADVTSSGYLLGLSDENPHRIALVKGVMTNGVPAAAPGALGVLQRGTATFAENTWHHLRLDMIVNNNGDVLLHCFQSDLNTNLVTAPDWVAVPGITNPFTDDALGINSGSAPYVSGYCGFGVCIKDTGRRAFFDHIQLLRQV